jgi:hypothetical protein
MFRASMCPSSGERAVSMRYLVLVILYGWLSGSTHSTLHTRQLSIQNNKQQVSHKYSFFSWWWAHSRPKSVDKRNKHTTKNCAPSWLYLQDYNLSMLDKIYIFTERWVIHIKLALNSPKSKMLMLWKFLYYCKVSFTHLMRTELVCFSKDKEAHSDRYLRSFVTFIFINSTEEGKRRKVHLPCKNCIRNIKRSGYLSRWDFFRVSRNIFSNFWSSLTSWRSALRDFSMY